MQGSTHSVAYLHQTIRSWEFGSWSSDDRLLLWEGELGVKGDPSPGSALTDQGTVLQHLSKTSRGECW